MPPPKKTEGKSEGSLLPFADFSPFTICGEKSHYVYFEDSFGDLLFLAKPEGVFLNFKGFDFQKRKIPDVNWFTAEYGGDQNPHERGRFWQ